MNFWFCHYNCSTHSSAHTPTCNGQLRHSHVVFIVAIYGIGLKISIVIVMKIMRWLWVKEEFIDYTRSFWELLITQYSRNNRWRLWEVLQVYLWRSMKACSSRERFIIMMFVASFCKNSKRLNSSFINSFPWNMDCFVVSQGPLQEASLGIWYRSYRRRTSAAYIQSCKR